MNSLQWLQFILSYFVQASFVIAAAWALERWTYAAETKTRIWTGCFVSLLGLLAVGLLLPRLHWIQPWSNLGPNELLVVANTEHVLGRSLLAFWVLGCCVMVVRWVFQFWDVRKFIRLCPEIDEKDQSYLQTLVQAELLRPNDRPVVFRLSPEELGPFCYQFHQPIVFLPISIIQGDRIELQHVLLHELTHLKTQHPIQLFTQKVVQVVLWFHPLVWISAKRASLVREFVCDDAVTDGRTSTVSYLKTLLHIVEHRSKPQSSTLSMGRTSSELKVRAKRLLSVDDIAVSKRGTLAWVGVFAIAIIASQTWLPTNPLTSPLARYSPWPSWSAATLHTLGVRVRDFEVFDSRLQMHELLEENDNLNADGA